MVFISFQTMELLWEGFKSFAMRFSEKGLQGFDFNPEYNKTLLVLFFNVMLALEILETIKVFTRSHTVKIRIILLICIIAVSRKVFVMDLHEANYIEDIGVATLILSLSLSYFLVARQLNTENNPET